jgi:hypothetical protein
MAWQGWGEAGKKPSRVRWGEARKTPASSHLLLRLLRPPQPPTSSSSSADPSLDLDLDRCHVTSSSIDLCHLTSSSSSSSAPPCCSDLAKRDEDVFVCVSESVCERECVCMCTWGPWEGLRGRGAFLDHCPQQSATLCRSCRLHSQGLDHTASTLLPPHRHRHESRQLEPLEPLKEELDRLQRLQRRVVLAG